MPSSTKIRSFLGSKSLSSERIYHNEWWHKNFAFPHQMLRFKTALEIHGPSVSYWSRWSFGPVILSLCCYCLLLSLPYKVRQSVLSTFRKQQDFFYGFSKIEKSILICLNTDKLKFHIYLGVNLSYISSEFQKWTVFSSMEIGVFLI